VFTEEAFWYMLEWILFSYAFSAPQIAGNQSDRKWNWIRLVLQTYPETITTVETPEGR
jgi:hypothetical protein